MVDSVTVTLACVQYGMSCLFLPCHEGRLEVVKYLCNQGGKELLMLTDYVSDFIMDVCAHVCACMCMIVDI